MNFKEFNKDSVTLHLTPSEKNVADWALDAMEISKDELFEPDVVLPQIIGNTLVIYKNQDVIDDFIYRITDQIKSMHKGIPKDHPDYNANFIKSAKSLATKLNLI